MDLAVEENLPEMRRNRVEEEVAAQAAEVVAQAAEVGKNRIKEEVVGKNRSEEEVGKDRSQEEEMGKNLAEEEDKNSMGEVISLLLFRCACFASKIYFAWRLLSSWVCCIPSGATLSSYCVSGQLRSAGKTCIWKSETGPCRIFSSVH
jgi:hypothetical protein